MPEQFDLTIPIVIPPKVYYKVSTLLLDWFQQIIRVTLVGNDNVELQFIYSGTEAVNLMLILNTANLTTNSLHKRILNKLMADGKIPSGSVTGLP